jgi:hypothetical protein
MVFLAVVTASSWHGVKERRIDWGKIGRSGRMG